MVVKNIIGDMGEKLAELGQQTVSDFKKQVGGGVVKSAGKQLGLDKTGQAGQKADVAKGLSGSDDSGREQFAQMLGGKKIDPAQLAAAKQTSAVQSQQALAKARQQIQNYQRIQQQIQQVRQKQAQEKQQEEVVEKQEEQKEEIKEEKKKKSLSASVAQFEGSREKSKFAVG